MIKTATKDMIPEQDKLTRIYRGVVEDVNDPLKAGRVRVRVFHIHTEKILKTSTEGIPTNELPWAEPCLPITEGSISGFGIWSVPVQGSHVVLFFEDGNPTRPMYFASLPGIPQSQESFTVYKETLDKRNTGFRDPDGVYPVKSKLGEPDVHRLARGTSQGTLVQTKNENKDENVAIAFGGSWDEPDSPYNAKYPHNMVITTHGGLTIELDSTPGSKRFNIYHPSNSFIECDNDGVLVIKNNSDRYEISLGDRYVHISQSNYKTIDNDEFKKVKGDKSEEIGGDVNYLVEGDIDNDINGNVNTDILKDETNAIHGDLNETVDGDRNSKIDGTLTIEVDGLITIKGNGGILIESGNVEITGGTIKAGSQGTMYKLMDSRLIDIYNAHTHGSDNSTPNDSISLGEANSDNLEAS